MNLSSKKRTLVAKLYIALLITDFPLCEEAFGICVEPIADFRARIALMLGFAHDSQGAPCMSAKRHQTSLPVVWTSLSGN
jgi:hypothetical protein